LFLGSSIQYKPLNKKQVFRYKQQKIEYRFESLSASKQNYYRQHNYLSKIKGTGNDDTIIKAKIEQVVGQMETFEEKSSLLPKQSTWQ